MLRCSRVESLEEPNTAVDPHLDDGVLRFQPEDGGKPIQVVTHVDGANFPETWLAAVERVDAHD